MGNTAWNKSVLGVFLLHIFLHSDWIWGDTEYLSVFIPNAENAPTAQNGQLIWLESAALNVRKKLRQESKIFDDYCNENNR